MTNKAFVGKSTLPYDILAVVIVAVWGLTFISTAVLLRYFSPAQIFLIRFSIAYAGMWFFSHDRIFADNIKDEAWLMLAGVAGGSIYFLTENTALEVSGQTSSISFIVCTTPMVTALLALAIGRRGEKLTWTLATGSLTALFGVALVMLSGSKSLGAPLEGYVLAMGASLTWAIYTLIIDKLGDRFDSAFITRKVFFYGIVTIIPIILYQDEPFEWGVFGNPVVWSNLLFLSVLASLACYGLWTPVIKRLGVIRSSNYIYLNPVFTLIGSLVLLHEPTTRVSLLGSAITLFGVWLACRKK